MIASNNQNPIENTLVVLENPENIFRKFFNHKPLFFGSIGGIILLSVVIWLYFSGKLNLPPIGPLSQPPKIDLTTGQLKDIKDPNAKDYIEDVDSKICDQANLGQAFGALLVPGEIGKPLENTNRKSLYGEKTWWYTLQGEVQNIEQTAQGIKYRIAKNQQQLDILATAQSAMFEIEYYPAEGNFPPQVKQTRSGRVEMNSLQKGDKAMFYLTVKCGGDNSPLLFLDTLQKIPLFVEKSAAVKFNVSNFANAACHVQQSNTL